MRKRYVFAAGLLTLAILLALIVWQVSFTFGEYAPNSLQQTWVYWAVSTLIFLLTVTLGFMLTRTAVKLWIERQSNREGSRIKTKLVAGAVALCVIPVAFLVAFSYAILNRNLDKWFSMPAEGVRVNLIETGRALDQQLAEHAQVLANWLALELKVRDLGDSTAFFGRVCRENRIAALTLERPGMTPLNLCVGQNETGYSARAEVPGLGTVVLRLRGPMDMEAQQREIARHIRDYDQLAAQRKSLRSLYLLFLMLITLFILFVATWIALIMARQISTPISSLLGAAREVRQGNLSHRVEVQAIDELATLVRGFNEMVQELEANSRELESRRRFTEAILESIPTGVISLSADGRIQRVNRALRGILSEEIVSRAQRLEDLLPREDLAEVQYLMKRARRTGVAASQIELETPRQVFPLAVTVAALPALPPDAPAFVVVLEDTSELLRAQKAAAWHEVARRIAHELKNPLTPIALCAERIARLLDRGPVTPDMTRVLRECAATISREVESVKNLADEFSQFSRLPTSQPVPSDLNEIVRNAMGVFAGRLDGIDVRLDLADHLALVNVDPEQFKRVVVNLVDNAAEAMQDSLVKRLLVSTQVTGEAVELMVADTGCGISAEDKEKLFLPYFTTKGHGTGLGLAIVSHILSEHGARIRVEDNRPAGARFLVEIPVLVGAEVEARA
jgi:PAS domain S-box-containing protein